MPHGATSQPHNTNNTQSCFPALPARSQTALRALRSIQITVTLSSGCRWQRRRQRPRGLPGQRQRVVPSRQRSGIVGERMTNGETYLSRERKPCCSCCRRKWNSTRMIDLNTLCGMRSSLLPLSTFLVGVGCFSGRMSAPSSDKVLVFRNRLRATQVPLSWVPDARWGSWQSISLSTDPPIESMRSRYLVDPLSSLNASNASNCRAPSKNITTLPATKSPQLKWHPHPPPSSPTTRSDPHPKTSSAPPC